VVANGDVLSQYRHTGGFPAREKGIVPALQLSKMAVFSKQDAP
jgi:hypothetical protein